MHPHRTALVSLALGATALALAACADTLPADVFGYADDCVRLNAEPIAPASGDDPHDGHKEVYACDVSLPEVEAAPPWPEGTLIVKESCFTGSCREDGAYAWLIATARKGPTGWRWAEYTRNFPDQDFVQIGSPESVCTDCHQTWEAQDWIATLYEP